MEKPIELLVYEIVGSQFCVASDDGNKVYQRLALALNRSRAVNLSFRNVAVLTSAFLNAAVGQAYGDYDEGVIRDLLSVQDLAAEDRILLKRVVETAKLYFANPDGFGATFQDDQASERDVEPGA